MDGRYWVANLLRDAVVAATRHIAEKHGKTCRVSVAIMNDMYGVSPTELWMSISAAVWSFENKVPDYVVDAETDLHCLPEVDRLCRVFFNGHEFRTHVVRFIFSLNQTEQFSARDVDV